MEGWRGSCADFRRGVAAYSRPLGDNVELSGAKPSRAVAATPNATVVKEAIQEAATTYQGVFAIVVGADCAGNVVSFLGRGVLYFGPSADTQVEHFSSAKYAVCNGSGYRRMRQ
jgi:hypothetical protein